MQTLENKNALKAPYNDNDVKLIWDWFGGVQTRLMISVFHYFTFSLTLLNDLLDKMPQTEFTCSVC